MDRREAILAQLFVTLQGVPGFATYVRNRGELPNDKRPSLILLDGAEVAKEAAFERGRTTASPNLMVLQPEIYISLDGRKPDNENVGQDLNAFRVLILKAIQADAVLDTLCCVRDGGEIQYRGCQTDLARGNPMNGEMGLDIAIIYPFQPSEL